MKRFSLLLLLCLQHFVNAQQLYFYKPEALKSIPSSESYNIIQDSKGYIWFSTEAGLCRYNGSAIQLFDEKKGLKEKACYSVKEDGKGNLWLVTSANRVLCLKSDSIWEAPFSKQYASSFKKSLEQTYLFQFENDNCFWLNTQTHTYLAFTNRTAYQKVAPEPSDADYYFLKSGNNYVPIKNKILDPNFNYHTKTPNQLKIILKNNGKETTLYIPHKLSSTPSWRVLSTTANNGSSYIAFENVLLTIDEGMHYSVEEFPNSILSIYSDKNNGLWIAMRKGGLRYYPDPNNRQYSINSLSEYSVSGVCVDNEQGVWCTTLEKGVFYCRNKYIVGYGSTAGLNQTADLLKSVNNRVFASTTANTLIELSNGKIIEYPLNFKAPFFVSDIPADLNKCLAFFRLP